VHVQTLAAVFLSWLRVIEDAVPAVAADCIHTAPLTPIRRMQFFRTTPAVVRVSIAALTPIPNRLLTHSLPLALDTFLS
jgi:hypothetical protein